MTRSTLVRPASMGHGLRLAGLANPANLAKRPNAA